MPIAPASSLALNSQNSDAFRRLDPLIDPAIQPGEPGPEHHGGPYTDVDDVVAGLGLPDDVEARLRRGLTDAGTGPDALRKCVAGPLRQLRDDTRDPLLVKMVATRFAAMLGTGVPAPAPMNKALPPGRPPMQPQATAPPGSPRPYLPAGVSPVAPSPGMPGAPVPGMPGRPPQGAPAGPMPGPRPAGGPPTQGGPAGAPGAAPGVPAPPPVPGQDPNEPIDLGGHDAESFGKLPAHERAKLTAGRDGVSGALDAHQTREPYDISTHPAVRASGAKHVRQVVQAGAMSPQESAAALELVGDLSSWAQKAKATPKLAADLIHRTVAKLGAAGEAGGTRRALAAVKTARAVLDALDQGGSKRSGRDYLGVGLALIEPGITGVLPAVKAGVADGDTMKGAAARRIWEQQPELAEVLGHEGWTKMGEVVEGLTGTDLDWQEDALGSAARLAHALAGLNERPEDAVLRHPKGAELVGKLLETQRDGGPEAQAASEPLRRKLSEHVATRADLPPSHRAEVAQRVEGAGPGKGAAAKVSGKDPKFKFSGGKMHVTLTHSPARAATSEAFGPHPDDAQAEEILTSPGVVVEWRQAGDDDPLERRARDGLAGAHAAWTEAKGSMTKSAAFCEQWGPR